ncbi:uncharacterized protein LOC143808971 [Ranitomeya variabilis]|uniref:uncharacterized protein LOC143808971 n=1 Tax=Ranitomeya variabilis TaxID=490064 RepID=UPI004056F698
MGRLMLYPESMLRIPYLEPRPRPFYLMPISLELSTIRTCGRSAGRLMTVMYFWPTHLLILILSLRVACGSEIDVSTPLRPSVCRSSSWYMTPSWLVRGGTEDTRVPKPIFLVANLPEGYQGLCSLLRARSPINSPVPAVEEKLTTMRQNLEVLKESLTTAQERYKRSADRFRKPAPMFKGRVVPPLQPVVIDGQEQFVVEEILIPGFAGIGSNI